MTDCIAIDDEPLALDIIGAFCRRLGGISLRTFTDPEEGLEAIRQTGPHIVFLDIELGNASGLEIAASLPVQTSVVFTTAHLHYACHGFDLDAADYLHKPFSFERFMKAVEKARRRSRYNASQRETGSITVKQEYNNVTIPLDDILYIEAMEGYSKIYRQSGQYTLTRMILKNLAARLPEQGFLRSHRSYVVPVSKVRNFNRQELTLSTGKTLPIGRQYSDAVLARLSS